MTRAIKWDGIGPKRDCLARVEWVPGGSADWVHVLWQEKDAELDQPEGYSCDFADVWIFSDGEKYVPSADDFAVTHYAELPTIADVSRIENDVEEGAVVS